MKLKTIAWSLLSVLKFAVIEAKFLLEKLGNLCDVCDGFVCVST